jgi:phospholipase/lecithinase/hemolysin
MKRAYKERNSVIFTRKSFKFLCNLVLFRTKQTLSISIFKDRELANNLRCKTTMKKQIVATGFVLFSFMLPLKATAATFSQLFVFGDSLSDTGNAFIATGGLVNPTQATPPSPPYFPGRFSNGRIWVDDLGSKLGLTPAVYANLIPGGPSPTEGINFAVGGATTGEFNAFVPSPPFPPSGLQAQINAFTSLKAAGLPADSNALYTVLAGGNDFISGSIDPSGSVNNVSKAVTRPLQRWRSKYPSE